MSDLAGLFRSPLLVTLLQLVLFEQGPWTAESLAERADAPYPTVTKEVRRLEAAGLITVETVGRTKLLSANGSEPTARALARALRAGGIGPLPVPEGGDEMAKKKAKKKGGKKKKK